MYMINDSFLGVRIAHRHCELSEAPCV